MTAGEGTVGEADGEGEEDEEEEEVCEVPLGEYDGDALTAGCVDVDVDVVVADEALEADDEDVNKDDSGPAFGGGPLREDSDDTPHNDDAVL